MPPSPTISGSALAAYIDHTLLKPDATRPDIVRLCAEAREHGFASVCVNPYWVPEAKAQLDGSDVKVCTVIGFPFGATTTAAKVCEANLALRDGARELDMVLNIGALRGGDEQPVREDIRAVADAAHAGGAILKVIFETALLNDDQKRLACRLSEEAGADFIKTSTGFGGGGATVADIELMRSGVSPHIGIKASGGIRTADDARRMIAAGATRIGASASVQIVQGASNSPASINY